MVQRPRHAQLARQAIERTTELADVTAIGGVRNGRAELRETRQQKPTPASAGEMLLSGAHRDGQEPDQRGSSTPWSNARNGRYVTPDKNLGRAAVQGWLSLEAATRLFQLAEQDYQKLKSTAASRASSP